MSTSISREEFQAELRAMRSDMTASQAELRADIAGLRTVFAESQRDTLKAVAVVSEAVAEIRGDISSVRGEVAGVKSAVTTTQWTIGMVVGVAALLLAGVQLFVAYKTPIATAQPSVIYVQPTPALETPATPSQK